MLGTLSVIFESFVWAYSWYEVACVAILSILWESILI